MKNDEEYNINILKAENKENNVENPFISNSFDYEKKDDKYVVKIEEFEKLSNGKYLTPTLTTKIKMSPKMIDHPRTRLRSKSPRKVVEKRIIDAMKRGVDFDNLYDLLINEEILVEEEYADKKVELNTKKNTCKY